ncbi:MAG: alanine--glyoxylate aminotransferase family protein [Desulfohalobiaceae bacterium]|nr:alanine--glyoxylate aminotransferase family protein [Desulfohalobiaceae bacterium]
MLNKQRLLTPGPTELAPQVKAALGRDMIHHRKQPFQEIMHRVQQELGLLFCTEQPVMPLACSGTGAMQAAVSNLFRHGDKVLVAKAGKFGQRWEDIARTQGLEVETLAYPWGEAIPPEDIGDRLREKPDIAGVLIQASETSTGVLHPVEEISRITRESHALLVVDGISAVGISPCPMDRWGLDCLITGSQKGLMLPPGLALISLSERAWDRAEGVDTDCFYFDLTKERDKVREGQTRFTTPVNLIYGLEAALELFKEAGLERIHRKQWALTQMTRSGVRAMGLKPFVPEHYTWGLTSLLLPDGVDGKALLDRIATEYGVYMAGGQEHLKGHLVRIGHMGYVDWSDLLAGLFALREVLSREVGLSAEPDFLEQAMEAYNRAWHAPLPHL